ncbi:MAG TPA: hypothetical protein VME21_05300 [Steroidobacteraceae bacterium]|nr:hypothetical protein [Steroidobacteraceae bacterium]
MRNSTIASAVAAAIAAAVTSSAFAYTGEPTAQTNAAAVPATNVFYMGGSSAAVSGIGSGIGADFCGSGNLITFQTIPARQPAAFNASTPFTNQGTPDFRAFYCPSVTKTGLTVSGQAILIYYRADGGSVVGAYGALNNKSINELDLTTAWCTADSTASTNTTYDCATSNNTPTTGSPPTGTQLVIGTNQGAGQVGTTDGYTGAVQKVGLQVGVSDEEPGVYGNGTGSPKWAGGGHDDPLKTSGLGAPYPYTFLGSDAPSATLQNMPHTLFAQQSMGFIASAALGITDITSAQAASILNGNLTDWGAVHNAAGNPVAAASTPIALCNRDLGSGTRSGAGIIFDGDGCNPNGNASSILDNNPTSDNFSTPDEILCVNNNAAGTAFGYVSTDNNSKLGSGKTYTGAVALTLDGRTASNLLSARGGWPYVVESSVQAATNGYGSGVNATNAASFFTYFIQNIGTLSDAPQSPQINALPNLSGNSPNTAGAALQSHGSTPVYVTDFVRTADQKGNSCNGLSAAYQE